MKDKLVNISRLFRNCVEPGASEKGVQLIRLSIPPIDLKQLSLALKCLIWGLSITNARIAH